MVLMPDFAQAMFWLTNSLKKDGGDDCRIVWRTMQNVNIGLFDMSFTCKLIGGKVHTFTSGRGKNYSDEYSGRYSVVQTYCDIYNATFQKGEELKKSYFTDQCPDWMKGHFKNGQFEFNGITARVAPVNGVPGLVFAADKKVANIRVGYVNAVNMAILRMCDAWKVGVLGVDCRPWLVIK